MALDDSPLIERHAANRSYTRPTRSSAKAERISLSCALISIKSLNKDRLHCSVSYKTSGSCAHSHGILDIASPPQKTTRSMTQSAPATVFAFTSPAQRQANRIFKLKLCQH